MYRLSRQLGVMLLAASWLAACTQSPPLGSEPSPTAQVQAEETTLRIVVNFKASVAYRDTGFLDRMGRQVGAKITYASSVSADTHVYVMQPLPRKTSNEVLKKMAELSDINWTELDLTMTPGKQK